jgi:hypothetical protein
VTTVL